MELRFHLGELEAEGLCALSETSYAVFAAPGFARNSIFDLSHELNRDDCLLPYYLLREKFRTHGIEINTPDTATEKPPLFELQMDAQQPGSSKAQYLLMLETPQIRPENSVAANSSCYRKVFTWDDRLTDGQRFIKINFPNSIRWHGMYGYEQRFRFCCLISSNRAAAVQDNRVLYTERVEVIRWFEANAPDDFQLYGVDWDIPQVRVGMLGKLQRRFWLESKKVVKLNPFPSYCGKVTSKSDILTKTRFAICFENVRDLPGYITEKIFDCFFSGCVPVYWGASNISDYIPNECFIDRRAFRDTEGVFLFLKAMSAEQFHGYQHRIATFLQSDSVHPFSSKFFVETIVDTIVQDIATQN